MWLGGAGYNARKRFLKAWKQASNFPQITKALGGFPHRFPSISLVKERVIYLQRDLWYKLPMGRAQEGHRYWISEALTFKRLEQGNYGSLKL